MALAGREKQISLRLVSTRMSQALIELCIERDRVERHLDVDRCRELSADPAHALSCRAFTLMALALEDEDVLRSCGGQVIGDACADDAAADDDHVRCLHRR